MTRGELERALDLAVQGSWDEAHAIVQADEADQTACWIHAVLHKIEGDARNARSWYRRASRMDHVDDEPTAELVAIRESLRG
jgi:hypothetical protein